MKQGLVFLLMAASLSGCQQATPETETPVAVSGELDRTILPIREPSRPLYKELDARNAKAPERFQVTAPKGAPNVVVILIDDIGFGAAERFGGPIKMPVLDKLARNGLSYNRFHTTALCSPSRVAILTGYNHHSNNAGSIMETGTAFPGNTGVRPQSITPMAEVLRQNGYSTAAYGKYHETPPWEISVSGSLDRWPTHSGFDKFYGFIGGETNQWAPLIYDGVTQVEIPGFDPTHHDPRYIRAWQVSKPKELPSGRDLYNADFPTNATEWLTFNSERRGMINLTREFGASNSRRYVWLRTKINAKTTRKVKLALGFSDDVWVYLNHGQVFVDKNDYRSAAMRKKPDGRLSTDNATIELPLKEGENELLVGLANDFFGWGLIALLDDLEGLTTSIDFSKPPEQPKDLTVYAGTYKSKDFPDIILTAENNVLMGKNPGQPAIALEYFDTNKFRYLPGDIVVEFHLDDRKFILKQGGKETIFIKE